jgi:iron complex outermembrane recepter protein
MNRSFVLRGQIRLICASFALAVSSIEMAHADEDSLTEVVVTAAFNKNPLESAQPAIVVSGDDLTRKIAGSLGQTLSNELGVSSSYFGPTASRPIIRGLGGYRVQTLQDGLATLDVSSLSDDHAVTVDPAIAEQLEVIKGPATLLYGSGASGGLINVVTRRVPTYNSKNNLQGMGEVRGSTVDDGRAAALEINAGSENFAIHGDYAKSKSSAIDIPSSTMSNRLRDELIANGEAPEPFEGTIPNAFSDSQGGAIGAAWLTGNETSGGMLGGSASRYETQYGIPSEETAFIDMKQDRYEAKTAWKFNGTWLRSIELSGAYNDYTHTEFEAPGEPGTIFDQQAYEVRLAIDHKHSDNWRGSFGAQLNNIDFVAEGDEAFVPPSITKSFGAFALEEFDVNQWTLNIGARFERQSIDVPADLESFSENAASFAAGAVWKLSAQDVLALNVTHSSRHPQATELYANGPHIASGRFEIGDSTLDIEKANTLDVSLRRNSDDLSWLLSVFYNDYSNFIYADPTGNIVDELIEVQYRQAGAKLYGYEAELWTPLCTTCGGRWRLRLMSDAVRGELKGGQPLPQIPPLRFGAGIHFDQAQWHASFDAIRHQAQNRVATNELPTDGFTQVQMDVSYTLIHNKTEWLFFVRGTNLLDKEARQHASALKDLVPLPGRSVNAGIHVNFN